MDNLFKQSPARRADFSVINPNSKFPKQFCQTRWIENADVCERAIEVYNSIKEGLVETKKLPGTKTVDTLKMAAKDPLTVLKIMFFSSVASLVEPYLRKFQSSKPIMRFQFLYSRFLRQEVIEGANTSSKLLKLDPDDPKIWCDLNKVDISVGANKYTTKGVAQKQITEKQRKSFNEDRIKFLSSMVSKLAEIRPLNYGIVSAVSAVDPNYITSSNVNAEKKFKN